MTAANDMQERRPVLTPEEKEEFCKYVYPFENIALEGGGSKGSAYVGTIRVLEEIGAWKNIKRFTGASIGALVSMWAALGYDSYEIEKLMAVNLGTLLYDARYGILSSMKNMYQVFGLHLGQRFLKWVGEHIVDKLEDPDATFSDLYQKTGRELCVVVSNVNQMDCVYCHVKTTPTMPIRIAVRMSCAIPGVLAPVKYTMHGSAQEVFCDGGLICNYPIHAYDGWYLSLKAADNFLRRTPDLTNVAEAWDISAKFGKEPNRKTIGVLLYSETEQEMFKVQLIERVKKYIPNPTPVPNTELSRKRRKNKKKQMEAAHNHDKLFQAMQAFLNLLKENDVDDSGTISRDELKNALDKAGSAFTKEQRDILFSNDKSADELFDSLDANKDGEISVNELTTYAEQLGLQIRTIFRGFEARKVNSVSSFFDGVIETLLLNVKKIFMKEDDLKRTIGIDTDYLDTLDFDMVAADKEFLLQQGKVAGIAFLRHHLETQQADGKVEDAHSSDDKEQEGNPNDKSKEKKPTTFYSIKSRSLKEESPVQITSEN